MNFLVFLHLVDLLPVINTLQTLVAVMLMDFCLSIRNCDFFLLNELSTSHLCSCSPSQSHGHCVVYLYTLEIASISPSFILISYVTRFNISCWLVAIQFFRHNFLIKFLNILHIPQDNFIDITSSDQEIVEDPNRTELRTSMYIEDFIK